MESLTYGRAGELGVNQVCQILEGKSESHSVVSGLQPHGLYSP